MAALQEKPDSSQVIDLSPKYDKSTFLGRYLDFSQRISTKFLLVTGPKVEEAKQIVAAATSNDKEALKRLKVTQKSFEDARDMVESTVHPQTGKEIPPHCRMSAFCPLNIPICAGMILTPPTVVNSIFWQWLNQTYNAFFNYANANKSASEDTTKKPFIEEYGDVIRGYSSATLVSVTLAVGLNQYLQRAKFSPAVRTGLQAVVPFMAVASAGVANVVFMRLNELSEGIPVYSKNGNYVGHSKEAAKSAIFQTALSRAVLPIPNLAIPPPILMMCYKIPAVRNNRVLKLMAELGVLYLCMSIGFPMAIAVFPQDSVLPQSKLEPELVKKIDASEYESGTELYVNFNKGV